ncbi:nuclear transport factor 2 family protein [Aestuariispira insulae]|uniref:Ketosteroid isomerase-like protein n=1 Tax=Aestuariispira insulae TaxID=1461337 RepID=A0A3D9HGJ7_9PROT|nr:nuclear transport factor 2 family protein [Aestuariispira insulae]RED48590.1 ketosteroid isomerase-like protein [Aestuariispira insulae]
MSDQHHATLIKAVNKASQDWMNAFNRGDAAGCAGAYEENAVMEASPFGRFEGAVQIEAFWRDLISQGFTDVTYIAPKLEILDSRRINLTAHWRMNKAHGIITREIWVLQPDGRARLQEDAFEVLG